MDRLLREFWSPLHPVIDDDGDCDARVAPLEWLNESLSMTLRVHVPMLNLAGLKPPKLTFAEWERMTVKELSGQVHSHEKAKAGDPVEDPLTRDDVMAYALTYLSKDIDTKIGFIQNCILCLDSLLSFVDAQLGRDSPNLSKLKGTLDAIERVLTQLLPEKKVEVMMVEIPQASEPEQAKVDNVTAPAVSLHGWKNRQEAYVTLSAIADYLSLVEPHSPTPYLLRRAVNWGRMPLPELMAEIIREEGDLNRLMNVLGLKE
jgi:type VI secretion system protein ImpA